VARRSIGARFRSLLPAAAGGLVAGHFLTYVFLAPAGPQRAAFLRQTGHGYFPRAIAVGAALGALAMGASAARGYARSSPTDRRITLRSLAVRFAAIQAIGFIGLEIVERMVVHAPLAGLIGVLPAGFVVETLVAFAVSWLLCATERVVATIVRAVRALRRRRRTRVALLPSSAAATGARLIAIFFGSSVTFRGPPLPSIV